MQKKSHQPAPAKEERGILTTAFGHQRYLNAAVNLARSCHFHSPGVPLAILTDQPENRSLRRHFDYVLPLAQSQSYRESSISEGLKFEHKFHLDRLSPFKKTLFLDSDCLLFADISDLFERFAGRVFQPSDLAILPPQWVQGPCQKWLMDLDKVCQHYGIRTLLRFNGGCFYFEKDTAASQAFFAKVREIFQLCSENNWIRRLTIEPIYDIAMQLTKINPDYSPGVRIMLKATLIPLEQRDRLCILRNRNSLFLDKENVSFRVLHFLEHSKELSLYLRESLKLKAREFFFLPAIAAFVVTWAYKPSLVLYRLFNSAKHLFNFSGDSRAWK